MTMTQNLTRFDKEYCIFRRKAGRRIKILADNYYAWTFNLTTQTILKYSLRT